MESTDSIAEEAAPTSSPTKEATASQVAVEEAGSVNQIPAASEDAEVNGTDNVNGNDTNGHSENHDQTEEAMDTSEPAPAPAAESGSGSTETTPIKTKAAMKDVSGIAEDFSEKTDEEPAEDAAPKDAFDSMVEGAKEDDKVENKSEEKAEEKVEKSEETKTEEPENSDEKETVENSEEKETVENSEEKETIENSDVKEEKAEENADNLEEKKEDAFDAMLSGQEKEKPKDAFDSMLSDEKEEEKPVKKVEDDSYVVEGADEEVKKTEGKDEEVVTVEDDGKPFEPEEAWLKEYKSDEDYFASLDSEELDWYKEHGPKIETAGESGLKCTACFKNVTIIIGSHNGVTRHFKLGVAICKGCKYFYKDGSGWEQDDEGLDKYCRWCGQGGEIMICDKCPSAFCKRCLQRNLGRTKVSEITKAEEWKCLFCDPKQIYDLRAIYHAVYQRFKSGNFKKVEVKTPRSAAKSPAKPKPEPVSKERIESIRKSPRNFVDENIFEAFKTLDVYQKCLEQERDRWIKNTKAMSVDNAVSTCRALRKIYAITKQNMDLLDKAIVQSFVEKYPKDSVKIHMGKVGVKVKEGALTGKPVSVKSHTKVKLKLPAKKKKAAAPKRKVLPKKKKKAAAASPKKGKTQEVVIMNGSPVYADPDDHDIFQVVRPSLSKKKAGPASKTSKKQQLFTKKKATRYSSDDDSDVVTLSSDDEKPSKPGPASRKRKPTTPIASPPKKRRPGPKSKTY